jgi:TetR/AcrR family transcriptional regulator, transcriptional repressor of bet genes
VITGRGLSADDTNAAPRALVAIVSHHLGRTEEADTADGRTSLALDAELILAAVGGTAQGILSGVYTPQKAVELVDRLLDLTLGTTNSCSRGL